MTRSPDPPPLDPAPPAYADPPSFDPPPEPPPNTDAAAPRDAPAIPPNPAPLAINPDPPVPSPELSQSPDVVREALPDHDSMPPDDVAETAVLVAAPATDWGAKSIVSMLLTFAGCLILCALGGGVYHLMTKPDETSLAGDSEFFDRDADSAKPQIAFNVKPQESTPESTNQSDSNEYKEHEAAAANAAENTPPRPDIDGPQTTAGRQVAANTSRPISDSAAVVLPRPAVAGQPENTPASSQPATPAPAANPVSDQPAMSGITAPPDETPATPEADILAMYRDDRATMFARDGYYRLRKIFAEKFERQFAADIRRAYATDVEGMQEWLDANRDIKEVFYTAIDQQHDSIHDALLLLDQLRRQYPKAVVDYGQLAIALAVVWDGRGGGVYDYAGHARRAKSSMPDKLIGALENFDYLVRFDRVGGNRIRFLPWEFLVLLVDHRTPIDERQWAVQNYLSQRRMIGGCYHDVPYDHVMLKTKSQQAALNGNPYTLPSIREHGGVCAMQADFAARVGKSIGVPAAYVRGPSTYGGYHAWVMWVELAGVSSKGIHFSLESHGRYRYDKYYVGTLADPQTGQQITDRTLELRLQLVGMDPIGKRHADLLMKSLPLIRAGHDLDAEEQLTFLQNVIEISPGNEAAWTAISHMSRDGMLTKEKHRRVMRKIVERLFYTFRNVPDFTWQIFDDLLKYEDDPIARLTNYSQLVQLYEKAERPDLACEARLKLTDYLMEEKRHRNAVEGLALTILKFAGEGRYVPRMLDRLESICDTAGGSQQAVLQFYASFLPKVPQRRGDEPSPYCIKMYERGIQRFKDAGDAQAAQRLQSQLEKIQTIQ